MNIIDNIIRELHQKITCPRCKRNYHKGEIRLAGMINNCFILETVCANRHEPICTLIVIEFRTKTPPRHIQKINCVSIKDKYRLKIFLNDFSGDFKGLFNGSKK